MTLRISDYDCFGENALLVGMAQGGKSWSLETLILQELGSMPDGRPINWWLFDPKAQHGWTPPNKHPPGWNPYITGAKVITELSQLREGKFILQPPRRAVDLFEKFCEMALHVWNQMIIFEETQLFITKLRMPPSFQEIITTGCNHGNTYVALTQRPAEVHNAVISNAHHKFVFPLEVESDKDLIGKWVGDREALDWLNSAPMYSYLYKRSKSARTNMQKPERCGPA